jgi:hypothetical protein
MNIGNVSIFAILLTRIVLQALQAFLSSLGISSLFNYPLQERDTVVEKYSVIVYTPLLITSTLTPEIMGGTRFKPDIPLKFAYNFSRKSVIGNYHTETSTEDSSSAGHVNAGMNQGTTP